MQMNMDFKKINLSRELLMNPSNHLRRLQYIIVVCFLFFVFVKLYDDTMIICVLRITASHMVSLPSNTFGRRRQTYNLIDMFVISTHAHINTLPLIRYHNTRMVNYDTHNGFSVSSVLMSSDEHHESTATHRHTQMANTSAAHTHKNVVSSTGSGSSSSSSSSSNSNGSGAGGGGGTGRTKKPTITPSISVLTINDVNFLHVGNYTCAPSNAKQASITVHVLRGKRLTASFVFHAIFPAYGQRWKL